MTDPTYVFEDGQVFTMRDGQVVAAVPDQQFSEPIDSQGQGPVEMPPPPDDIQGDLGMDGAEANCPSCGSPSSPGDSFCPNCGTELSQQGGPDQGPWDAGSAQQADAYPPNAMPDYSGAPQYSSTVATITTPNGLTGRVLGKVAGLWGDQVTVRLENGNIVHLPVHKDYKFASVEEVHEEPVKALNTRLAATSDSDVDSLKDRARELDAIRNEAAQLVEGVSDVEATNLEEIIVTAGYERQEIVDVLQHLAELEGQAYEPPAPFRIQAVEQEAVNGADGSWLDQTLGEMIAEAEATDWGKLMQEGPEAFVAGLDEPALANAGTTREIASRWIRSKTAATDPSVRAGYERTWLTRIEEVRRAELATRKQAVQQKEAAIAEEDYSGLPDEFGFGV